jgi:NAD-specific glutamate dehydrogenase
MSFTLGIDGEQMTLTNRDNWESYVDGIFKFRVCNLKPEHTYVIGITATAHDRYLGDVISYAIGDVITIKPLWTPTVTP